MSTLENSSRRLYKATYAPIQTSDADAATSATRTRAFEKASFVRSLQIREAELQRLADAVRAAQGDAARRQALAQAMAAVETMTKDAAETATVRHAALLAPVPASAVSALGSLLAEVRRALASQVEQALSTIRRDHLTATLAVAGASANDPAGVTAQIAAATPPPLEDSIRWAVDHESDRAAFLRSLAYEIADSAPIYSNADTAAAITSLATRVAGAGDWTGRLVAGFDERMKIEPVGRLHLERLEMTPAGIERGELVHSVPMAPLETVNLAHKEWSTQNQEFDSLVADHFEGYSEEGVVDKTDITHSTNTQSQHSTALNLSAAASGGYGPVTISTSVGYASTSADAFAQTDSRNHAIDLTRKASARAKKDHKISFKVASLVGSEDQTIRKITNPSPTDAMRVDYYQLLRKWRVDLYRYGVRMTYDVVIPNPGADLSAKVEELRSLNAKLDGSFAFPLAVDSITRDNWTMLAAAYGGGVDAPPDESMSLYSEKVTAFVGDSDSDTTRIDSFQFNIDPAYEIKDARLTSWYLPWPDITTTFRVFSSDDVAAVDDLGDGHTPGTRPGHYEIELSALTGRSGSTSIAFEYRGISSAWVNATITATLKTAAFKQWQLRVWTALRQAAQDAFNVEKQTLQNRRTQLLEEMGQVDALTLRRLENEAIMKGVMRWLFGPTFEFLPKDLGKLYRPLDASDPLSVDILDPSKLSSSSWQRAMEFGEFIKYVQQAIEWENLLYFPYPYFWDSPKNWSAKLFLEHPDRLHQTFLRAGCARVVLTIRPGFEKSFAALIESGAFGELPSDHPYVTIAQEIEDYANTNYPGIPPANPAADPDGDSAQNAEKGILIGRWHEYTPSSALDIAINTKYPDMG